MKKIEPTIIKETLYILVCVVILSVLMEAVFLFIRRWDYTVLLGNLLTGFAVTLNFFLMGLGVQRALGKDEKEAKKRAKQEEKEARERAKQKAKQAKDEARLAKKGKGTGKSTGSGSSSESGSNPGKGGGKGSGKKSASSRKAKEKKISALMYVLTILFILKYVFL